MGSLNKYQSNNYSANGEDGVLQEIIDRLKISRGWLVEFGAWDGKRGSNTYSLITKGWNGLYIEGDQERYKELIKTASNHSKLHILQKFITVENKNSLDQILKAYSSIPTDFEVLSIDIDSFDYLVWKSLRQYTPKIVIIEINSSVPPGIKYIHPPTLKPKRYPFKIGDGSTFTSTINLGKRKGYTLVCHTGNLFFVRNDILNKLNLPANEISHPNKLFQHSYIKSYSPWYKFISMIAQYNI